MLFPCSTLYVLCQLGDFGEPSRDCMQLRSCHHARDGLQAPLAMSGAGKAAREFLGDEDCMSTVLSSSNPKEQGSRDIPVQVAFKVWLLVAEEMPMCRSSSNDKVCHYFSTSAGSPRSLLFLRFESISFVRFNRRCL